MRLNNRIKRHLCVLGAVLLLISALPVAALAASGSTTITAEVKHDRMIIIPTEPQSPQTGDPGVALYGVLSVSALMGMGWVGKKKKQ